MISRIDSINRVRIFLFLRSRWEKVLLLCTGSMLILISYSVRFRLLQIRKFDPDEFEHLHTTWCITKGLIPYRDFFEHHTPLFYFFLAPLVRLYQVETSVDDAISMIFSARTVMWMMTGCIVILTFYLGLAWRGWRVGLISAVFLMNTVMFLEKSLEIRPDVLALLFWMGSLVFLIYGLRSHDKLAGRSRILFFSSGFLLGIAIMSTQKILFAVPGVAVILAWYALDSRLPGTKRIKRLDILCYMLGVGVITLAVTGYFAFHNGFGAFIEWNLLFNIFYLARVEPHVYLRELVRQNPFIMIVGAMGLLHTAFMMYRTVKRSDFMLLLNTAGFLVGMYIMPVPYRQYFMLFIPLICLFAAGFLVDSLDYIAHLRRFVSELSVPYKIYSTALFATGLYIISTALDITSPQEVIPAFWFMILAGIAAAVYFAVSYRVYAGAALLIAVFSIYPARQLYDSFSSGNMEQLAMVRYVMEHTKPGDTVMDGWPGFAIFRPHAHFFWIFHQEFRMMYTGEQVRDILQGLESGRIRPQLVNLDGHLLSFSNEVTQFLLTHYEPVGNGNFYRLRDR